MLFRSYQLTSQNDKLIREPDATIWGRWLVRKDFDLVRNQIKNLLIYAQQEQMLTMNYMQKTMQAFLEAISIACYENQKKLQDIFDENFTYEHILDSYHSLEALAKSVDFCIHRYQLLIHEEDEGERLYSVKERIQEIIQYLDNNMDRMITRREAAKYVFLNEDYFSRMFRKETGLGYKEYLLNIKMEYAKKLLIETKIPVALIASKVGYDNYSNFTQMFRKVVGVTPSA